MASIKKISTRKYKITVCNGYRPSGKKISKSKTITVPESVRGRSIAQYVVHEAEEIERRFRTGYAEDAKLSFEEYSSRWLTRQTKYAPSTIAFYRRCLDRVYPFIGKIALEKLRPVTMENMLIELRKRKHKGKSISEATVQKHLTVVSAVLSDAKRNEIIEKNVARMVDLPTVISPVQDIPSDDEARRFLELLVNGPYLYMVYYALALFTGCRRGELCALKWTDFYVCGYEGVLTISRSRTNVAGRGVIEGPPKNGKPRSIFLNETAIGIVKGLYCHEMDNADSQHRAVSEYLFVGEDGKPMHPDTFTKHIRKLLDRNGFSKGFHLHTLRHYFVSAMLHNGVDKQTVAELAGHGDTSFLERTYCHPQMALKQNAARMLNGNLFDAPFPAAPIKSITA